MKVVFVALLIVSFTGCQKDVEAECVEKPDNGAACYTLYDPVCGCNGKTYGNACEAGRVGIVNFTKGECKK
ncbi:MAG: Kazal-type serine protease inhibitor family protein [Spirosomataceae bacterium]